MSPQPLSSRRGGRSSRGGCLVLVGSSLFLVLVLILLLPFAQAEGHGGGHDKNEEDDERYCKLKENEENKKNINVFHQWGFSTLSCRCENDEFELVLVKSSRPTSISVCSKKSKFLYFWTNFQIFSCQFWYQNNCHQISFPLVLFTTLLKHYFSTKMEFKLYFST